jgi:hypothetical protein
MFEPIATPNFLSNTKNAGGGDYSTTHVIFNIQSTSYYVPVCCIPYIINNNEIPMCMAMDKPCQYSFFRNNLSAENTCSSFNIPVMCNNGQEHIYIGTYFKSTMLLREFKHSTLISYFWVTFISHTRQVT